MWHEFVIFISFQFTFLVTCFDDLHFIAAISFVLLFNKLSFRVSYSIHWKSSIFTAYKNYLHILVYIYILIKCSFTWLILDWPKLSSAINRFPSSMDPLELWLEPQYPNWKLHGKFLEIWKFLSWIHSNSSFSFLYAFIYLFIFEFYSIKPSHFTEPRIYVKLDFKVLNTRYTWEKHIEKKRIYITNSVFVIWSIGSYMQTSLPV